MRAVSRLLTLLPLASFAVGCGVSSPYAGTPATVPDSLDLPADAERYVLRPPEAALEADVSAGASYTLLFPRQEGVLVLSPTKLEASTIEFSVDMTSVDASWHVVSDIAGVEFLHVAAYPKASFVSKAMRRRDDGDFDVFGEFELHGKKETIAVIASMAVDECRVSVGTEFSIGRKAFGLVSQGSLEPLVSDRVGIRIAAKTKRKDAPSSCEQVAGVASDDAPSRKN